MEILRMIIAPGGAILKKEKILNTSEKNAALKTNDSGQAPGARMTRDALFELEQKEKTKS